MRRERQSGFKLAAFILLATVALTGMRDKQYGPINCSWIAASGRLSCNVLFSAHENQFSPVFKHTIKTKSSSLLLSYMQSFIFKSQCVLWHT